MALEDDDLISIDALAKGAINNNGVVPAQLGVFMTQGETDPVYSLPYAATQSYIFPETYIGNEYTWTKTFQYPKQKILLDIEFYIPAATAWTPWDLSGWTITTTGIDLAVIYLPQNEDSIYGLSVNGCALVTHKAGQTYNIAADGCLLFPARILFLSKSELKTTETNREITITFKTGNNASIKPKGFFHVSPLPSSTDSL
ncbi:hypothetical protein G3D33_001417 [Salmonella enterica subsp. salamae]|nr:hypothetical protein [Salmonella enterica subsp. salamae]